MRADGEQHVSPEVANRRTCEWYSGAEIELIQSHGFEVDASPEYSGIGQAPVTVGTGRRGRYCASPDEAGLLGQRLMWTAKGIWMVLSCMDAPMHSDYRYRMLQSLWPMAARARAHLRELSRGHIAKDCNRRDDLRDGLKLLARVGLCSLRAPPRSYLAYPPKMTETPTTNFIMRMISPSGHTSRLLRRGGRNTCGKPAHGREAPQNESATE